MVIFHCYVSSPEGMENCNVHHFLIFSMAKPAKGMLEPSISLTVPMARLVLQSTRRVFQKGQTSMRPQVAGRLRAVRISGHGINQELE